MSEPPVATPVIDAEPLPAESPVQAVEVAVSPAIATAGEPAAASAAPTEPIEPTAEPIEITAEPAAATGPIEGAAALAAVSAATGEPGATEAPPTKRARKGDKRRARRPRRAPADDEEHISLEGIEHLPEALQKAIAEHTTVSGQVIGWNQGGFHVAIDGTPAFCPRSAMELGAPQAPTTYLDQKFDFKVLRVDDQGKRVVVSRAAVLREQRKAHAAELRQSIHVGDVLAGRVVALTDFGAFVDLGGVEGLVHVSEIRRSRVNHPSEALTAGQEVQVKVLKIGASGERLSLSIKALEPDPWAAVAERYAAGKEFSGKVLRKAEFGLFIELEPGIEGLLHLSQLPPGKTMDDPTYAAGEAVTGWIREVDLERKRLSLALREVPTGNPWKDVETKYPEGGLVRGKVEKVAPFGVFVQLEPGLTGLLPGSETGLPRGASLGKAYPLGKEVSVQVAHVDSRRKRISLTVEGKTLEGSRSDYQAYLKKSRQTGGFGPMAAALRKLAKT